MEITKLTIKDMLLIREKPFQDARGAFEANWDSDFLKDTGINFRPQNACHSYNIKANTLRGMHYQQAPFGQSKWVSCITGSLYDVTVDLRTDSPTFLKWESVTLTGGGGASVYIPAGCAHGFVTIEENTTVAYLIEGNYHPEAAAAIRWNDPLINIEWPVAGEQLILSDRDKNLPDFSI